MTVEPLVLLEKEISMDASFTAIKESFSTWDDTGNPIALDDSVLLGNSPAV